MVTTALDLLAPVYRVSIYEYERMGEIGLFDQKRVELIEGPDATLEPAALPGVRVPLAPIFDAIAGRTG